MAHSPAGAPPGGEEPSVLIFEDDFELVGGWRQALEARGFAIAHVSDLESAEIVRTGRRFDVWIVDLFIRDASGAPMPEGGLTLLGRLQRIPRDQRPFTIAVSGNADPSRFSLAPLAIAERVGAAAVLQKPFAPEELAQAVVDGLAARASR